MHPKVDISVATPVAAKSGTAGIIAGTTVMTLEGELPVEHLAVGDRVITRDSGMSVLRDIRVLTTEVATVRIKAGSLGHTRPDRDMEVGPDTLVHIRDWRAEALYGKPTALVPASRLVDGEFVSVQDLKTVTVFELVFDKQHIVYADGIELATA